MVSRMVVQFRSPIHDGERRIRRPWLSKERYDRRLLEQSSRSIVLPQSHWALPSHSASAIHYHQVCFGITTRLQSWWKPIGRVLPRGLGKGIESSDLWWKLILNQNSRLSIILSMKYLLLEAQTSSWRNKLIKHQLEIWRYDEGDGVLDILCTPLQTIEVWAQKHITPNT